MKQTITIFFLVLPTFIFGQIPLNKALWTSHENGDSFFVFYDDSSFKKYISSSLLCDKQFMEFKGNYQIEADKLTLDYDKRYDGFYGSFSESTTGLADCEAFKSDYRSIDLLIVGHYGEFVIPFAQIDHGDSHYLANEDGHLRLTLSKYRNQPNVTIRWQEHPTINIEMWDAVNTTYVLNFNPSSSNYYTNRLVEYTIERSTTNALVLSYNSLDKRRHSRVYKTRNNSLKIPGE